MESIKTLCPYCGVGCGLEITPLAQKEHQPWRVKGDRSHPSSQGMVCVKGATITESINKNRLHYPMFRKSLNEDFQR
ncbi:MAG: nitrate reductase catalytic subunit, partial [Cuspidothrix sp.]